MASLFQARSKYGIGDWLFYEYLKALLNLNFRLFQTYLIQETNNLVLVDWPTQMNLDNRMILTSLKVSWIQNEFMCNYNHTCKHHKHPNSHNGTIHNNHNNRRDMKVVQAFWFFVVFYWRCCQKFRSLLTDEILNVTAAFMLASFAKGRKDSA